MLTLIINYATLLSYIAFSVDLLFQIVKLYKRKSSRDISWKGTTLRLTGSAIILFKFLTLQDTYLVLGQILFSLTIFVYLLMILYYRD